MVCFLTSSPGGNFKEDGIRRPCPFDARNGFVMQLRQRWKERAKGLLIASDPDNIQMNDEMKCIFENTFAQTGLDVAQLDTWDCRNDSDFYKLLEAYDFLILSGGHVPTQNLFFEELHLEEWIKEFQGIIIGISAGTMNSAETVYAPPELEEEAKNPEYTKYLKGLGLTSFQIIPHYQELKRERLNGKRVMEDIIYPDSKKHAFYAIPDGSFFMIENHKTELFGEAYQISDGVVTKCCEENHSISI